MRTEMQRCGHSQHAYGSVSVVWNQDSWDSWRDSDHTAQSTQLAAWHARPQNWSDSPTTWVDNSGLMHVNVGCRSYVTPSDDPAADWMSPALIFTAEVSQQSRFALPCCMRSTLLFAAHAAWGSNA